MSKSFAPNHRRSDDGEAFLPDPSTSAHGRTYGADAEFMAEEFLASVTSGESVEQDAADEVSDDELGGPFIEENSADLDDLPADTLPEPSFDKTY